MRIKAARIVGKREIYGFICAMNILLLRYYKVHLDG